MSVLSPKPSLGPEAAAHPPGSRGQGAFHLDLSLRCDRQQQTFVAHQYAAYPFRLSRVFRLDPGNAQRAYLYMMNSSPGLLAGDDLRIRLDIGNHTQVYLTDQAATKVHTAPLPGLMARSTYQVTVGAGASLEFMPEPLILYKDASFEQLVNVTLQPSSQLFLTEIVIPGRLARAEYYDFNYYLSRLRVTASDQTLICGDAMRLEGKLNPFKESVFFAKFPVIASVVVVLPDCNLAAITNNIDAFAADKKLQLLMGYSQLPNCNGLLIRMMGSEVGLLQDGAKCILNHIRQETCQAPLPEVPK